MEKFRITKPRSAVYFSSHSFEHIRLFVILSLFIFSLEANLYFDFNFFYVLCYLETISLGGRIGIICKGSFRSLIIRTHFTLCALMQQQVISYFVLYASIVIAWPETLKLKKTV